MGQLHLASAKRQSVLEAFLGAGEHVLFVCGACTAIPFIHFGWFCCMSLPPKWAHPNGAHRLHHSFVAPLEASSQSTKWWTVAACRSNQIPAGTEQRWLIQAPSFLLQLQPASDCGTDCLSLGQHSLSSGAQGSMPYMHSTGSSPDLRLSPKQQICFDFTKGLCSR